jgi:hypothetical protein
MSDRDDLASLRDENQRLRAELETARKDAFAHAAVVLASWISARERCPACNGGAARDFLQQLHRVVTPPSTAAK